MQQAEDGAEDVGHAGGEAEDVEDGGVDLAEDDGEGAVEVQGSNEGQDSGDDGVGDVEDQAKDGVELDTDDGENIWNALAAAAAVPSWAIVTYRP